MNEPVAWRTHYPSGWEYKDGNPPFELKGNSQLLYINPIKEQRMIDVLMELSKYRLLSKEEIEEVAILRKIQEVNPI